MVLLGEGERIYGFDVGEREFCEHCRQQRDFGMRLKYRYGHFYHLFGWVIESQYQLVCPECEHGWLLNADRAKAMLGGNPIPFHQRSGGIVGIVLLHLLAIALLFRHGVI